jgi:hypothetical protein
MDYINYPFIPFKPSEKSVLRRLGYNKDIQIDESMMLQTKEMIDKAADLCLPKARAVILPIIEKDKEYIILGEILKIKSEKLSSMLKNSEEVLLMGATLGTRLVDRINLEIKSGDPVFAVVLDAYASQCVDESLSYIMKTQGLKDFRLGTKITKHRFSAGYGDLNIKYQKDFYDILNLSDIGIYINESFMLSPEKSVIALAGLEKK